SAVPEDRLRIGYAATVSVGILAGLRDIELPLPLYANRLSVNSFPISFSISVFYTIFGGEKNKHDHTGEYKANL
ncbi:MAG: hypothetical protein J1F13_07620, partial [Prevotellaceae bacterium]|nr:hypothetical protein [Prevotellaceae bacterium]